jgi:hypothetical protein
MNKRIPRQMIQEEKAKRYPRGLDWDGADVFSRYMIMTLRYPYSVGIVHQTEIDVQRPPQDRYYHYAGVQQGIRLAIVGNPTLVETVHNAPYMAADFTFKRVRGDLNEWEMAIKHPGLNSRTLVSPLARSQLTVLRR